MRMKWKPTLLMTLLIFSLLIPSASFLAIAEEGVPVTKEYSLTSTVKAAVKSILNEQVAEGTRIGAVVRLTNEGTRLTRVPDYEVRVKAEDGVLYTLRPSAENVIAIQPKETVELSYMIVIDREDTFSLSEISWVDVDEFVSPRSEKMIVSIPISSIEWRGDIAVFSDALATHSWGENMTIQVLSTSLEYKPVSLSEQNTPQGPKTIVGLLATNKSDKKKAIPDFRVNGRSDKKVYTGVRLEKDPIVLGPGEQQYIHYAIPAGKKEELIGLTVLTPESFATDDKTKIEYLIGQFNVALPQDGGVVSEADQPKMYVWNSPIQFDPLNNVVQPEVSVSMVTLQMHESVGGGFKAAVAKFKLTNRSDRPMPVPKFQAQLMGVGGTKYTGTRQTAVVETLIPNVSYVMYYSFVLPSNEKGEQLTMDILDSESVAPYNIPIATFKTMVKKEKSEDTGLSFYPFNVKINSWKSEVFYGSARESFPYSYKLSIDMDVSLQEEVVVDQNFPKLKVELVDDKGKVIGSKTLPFIGENRVATGTQTVNMDSVLYEFSNSLRVYETIDTPYGQADRLIATLQ
ncbi:hypothetical protein [Paenibacillus sp. UNC451MF]|uniref:hypothetical protein n=1 Tax=Paenibacillus sp. UNC451MF TaxID=1449063 RepID=UPI00048C4C23|nr:hypothetical protein [Paenibacillus sp. UNC451MF]